MRDTHTGDDCRIPEDDRCVHGAELLGLDEHIRNVIAAMRPIAGELGLAPSTAAWTAD